MFDKFNRVVVVDEEKIMDCMHAFNELEIDRYELVELGLGKSGVWCVAFKCNKKDFNKFIGRVRVNYIAKR